MPRYPVFLAFEHVHRDARPDDAYRALAADPPDGFTFGYEGTTPYLNGTWDAPDPLTAYAEACHHVKTRYGTPVTDGGVEKVYEWFGDHELSYRILAHLLLMAAHRANTLGISRNDLIHFLNRAT